MPRTQITVRLPAEAVAATDAGIDAVAVNFVRGSSRFIEPGEAWKIVSSLPPLVSSVGIFANASLDTFSDIEEVCPTAWSQLQGSEDETLVRECGPNIIKAVRFTPTADGSISPDALSALERELARWDRIDEVDAILLDLPMNLVPGSYAALAERTGDLTKPLFLAGHMTPGTIPALIANFRPYALDLTDAAERDGGGLDVRKLNALCSAIG